MYSYSQTTGELLRDGVLVGHGYSGFPPGKNDPATQKVHNVGPIPRGVWKIGPAADYPGSFGPVVMTLHPEEGTEDFGRGGFLIHGDSSVHPGLASHGCIILSHDIRVAISKSGDTDLTVTA